MILWFLGVSSRKKFTLEQSSLRFHPANNSVLHFITATIKTYLEIKIANGLFRIEQPFFYNLLGFKKIKLARGGGSGEFHMIGLANMKEKANPFSELWRRRSSEIYGQRLLRCCYKYN